MLLGLDSDRGAHPGQDGRLFRYVRIAGMIAESKKLHDARAEQQAKCGKRRIRANARAIANLLRQSLQSVTCLSAMSAESNCPFTSAITPLGRSFSR